MDKIVIAGAVRTPIGKLGGELSTVSAVELGTLVVKEAMKRAKVQPQDVDQVIFGNVLQAGNGQNVARQVEVNAGIPVSSTAMTVNEVCGSGLKSVRLGQSAIMMGDADIVVVGGTENMSQAPYLDKTTRWGHKFGNVTLEDEMLVDGLTDAFSQRHMGITAENVANRFHVTREQQDAFGVQSQQRAAAATKAGYFDAEKIPVTVHTRKGDVVVDTDQQIRDTSLELMGKLRPAFAKDGSVTAGNSSGINDGAAALVLMRASKAEELGVPVLGSIEGYAEVGIDPEIMGYAPYYAIPKAVAQAGLTLDDIDLFEINEAYASQSVAVTRDLKLDLDKVNISGGAIALGHPIGASGARILTTLLYNMQRLDKHEGVAGICIGGGLGIAMNVKRA
ncbi:acetyl-CoA C-acetyltransferase [Lactobacillus selangorensis]|nr:acetyl-CoA C-acetyltransferase [Lactobacillus selangorensis]